jgi:GNAT superfamily N-acetyltransferase
LKIRELRTEDEPIWRGLWAGYLTYYKAPVSQEIYTKTFARLIDPARKNQRAFLAVDEREMPVGLVHFIVHPHNWREEDVVYLQDLFVADPARGLGAGRALIEAVYAWADENGTPSVYWLTEEFNATARQLYDRIATLTPFIKYVR